jgi:hypothetical protein
MNKPRKVKITICFVAAIVSDDPEDHKWRISHSGQCVSYVCCIQSIRQSLPRFSPISIKKDPPLTNRGDYVVIRAMTITRYSTNSRIQNLKTFKSLEILICSENHAFIRRFHFILKFKLLTLQEKILKVGQCHPSHEKRVTNFVTKKFKRLVRWLLHIVTEVRLSSLEDSSLMQTPCCWS